MFHATRDVRRLVSSLFTKIGKPSISFQKKYILQQINVHHEEINYLHVGLVRVAIKPIFRLGHCIIVLISLRNKRHEDFSNFLLTMVQPNLDNGPIYFHCYPNFIISLNDPHIYILSSWIYSQISEYERNFLVGIFRINYKWMNTNISPKALRSTPKGSTMFNHVHVNLTRLQTRAASNFQIFYVILFMSQARFSF